MHEYLLSKALCFCCCHDPTLSLVFLMTPATSFLQLVLTSVLLLWPARHCPDLQCPEAVVTKRIPDSVVSSLEFAQHAATHCERRSSTSFSGFWFGFCCGLLCCLIFTMIVYILFRCLTRYLVTQPSSTSLTAGNIRQARTLSALGPSTPSASSQDLQPATPAQLRAAGLS